jgi:hypothetical protein
MTGDFSNSRVGRPAPAPHPPSCALSTIARRCKRRQSGRKSRQNRGLSGEC